MEVNIMSYTKSKEIEPIQQEIKEARSEELFSKHTNELNEDECKLLDEYAKDYKNPEWRPIIIDDKLTPYEVSSIGDIRSKKTGIVMKQKTNRYGYKMINLMIDYVKRTFSIHRLVATAFIENNDSSRTIVNHKNGNKGFNWRGNLEWCTQQENTQHAIANNLAGRYGIENPNNKYSEEDIHTVCKLLEQGKEATEIEKLTGISKNVSNHIKCGKQWQNIASQYNIPKPVNNKKPPEMIAKMTELVLSRQYTDMEVAKMIGLPETDFYKAYVGLFRRRLFKKMNIT